MAEQKMTIKDLTALCSTIHNMMRRNQLNELDDFLRNLDLSQSIDYLVGTVRYSSPFRNQLKEWAITRNKIYAEILERDESEEVDSIMEGLFDDDEGQGLEAFYKIERLIRHQKR